jgi:acyl-CoA thioesterase YciA
MIKLMKKLPIIRVVALPKHLGPSETIFGGWLISKMDLAGGISALDKTNGIIRTVSCNNINFHKPVLVADVVSCYTEIMEIKNSSIKVKVDMEVYRINTNKMFKALDGYFTYVAVDENGNPRKIKENIPEKGGEKTIDETSCYSHS